LKLHAQIEILASLQTVDREIREQTGLKQGLLCELSTQETSIAAKQEIDQLEALSAKKKNPPERPVLQEESKKAVDRRMRKQGSRTSRSRRRCNGKSTDQTEQRRTRRILDPSDGRATHPRQYENQAR
jgi:hypothetical protein